VTRVLYPGSFDPVHNGHLEIIEVAASLFDGVVVAVIRNPQKSQGLFDLEERTKMIEESVAELPNVSVVSLSTLVVELVREVGADFIVKGLRAVSDFESELQQAQMNLATSRSRGGIHTVFIPSASDHSFIASKYVREIAKLGGDVSSLVPEPVARRLGERFEDKDGVR
jgi:pantetheine-phosphate adenylyltransferase